MIGVTEMLIIFRTKQMTKYVKKNQLKLKLKTLQDRKTFLYSAHFTIKIDFFFFQFSFLKIFIASFLHRLMTSQTNFIYFRPIIKIIMKDHGIKKFWTVGHQNLKHKSFQKKIFLILVLLSVDDFWSFFNAKHDVRILIYLWIFKY